MKQHIETLLQVALKQFQAETELSTMPAHIEINATKDKQHGDFATNIAMIIAKLSQKKPRDIAERLIQLLPSSSYIEKTEVAGPGFINFFLTSQALTEIIRKVLSEKETFGRSKMGREKRLLVEFLSSNPTGPLHVGHGRHAAYGAVICNLLDAVGFKVYREYYVNDAGRQVDILTVSVWLRYLALCGEAIIFPANAYRGDYVIDIAKTIYAEYEKHFYCLASLIYADLPHDEPQGGDKEIYIDAVIERAKKILDIDKYTLLFNLSVDKMIAEMKDDLTEFGVLYDNWFSERQFIATEVVNNLLKKLTASGHVYKRDNALWFRATDFGHEKDRVLIRSNGVHTYFVNDLAYHLHKFEREFDLVVNIFGADHHGYAQHMKAGIEACGIHPERWIYLLLQFVALYRNGKPVQMSTRGGSFVTLRELREEVGNDVARFFYVMRKGDQAMDFDLDLAKAQSNENPVYYIQYAYARMCSVLRQLIERGLKYDEVNGLAHLNLLSQPPERQLLNTISRYPDTIVNAALHYEPHQLTNYLRELAADFHTYYNSYQFLVEEVALRDARLTLMMATRQTLLNGFNLLGITAPERM